MIDFNTALARLLGDGKLRDAFAADPVAVLLGMPLAEADRAALKSLQPSDLEVQANILLRKRFELVERNLPRTCESAGWPAFRNYARVFWAKDEGQDALGFCEFLEVESPHAVDAFERNRLRFQSGSRMFRIFWVSRTLDAPAGAQVFWRCRGGWREKFFAARL